MKKAGIIFSVMVLFPLFLSAESTLGDVCEKLDIINTLLINLHIVTSLIVGLLLWLIYQKSVHSSY